MEANPPQIVETGIFSGYKNLIIADGQFIEVIVFQNFSHGSYE